MTKNFFRQFCVPQLAQFFDRIRGMLLVILALQIKLRYFSRKNIFKVTSMRDVGKRAFKLRENQSILSACSKFVIGGKITNYSRDPEKQVTIILFPVSFCRKSLEFFVCHLQNQKSGRHYSLLRRNIKRICEVCFHVSLFELQKGFIGNTVADSTGPRVELLPSRHRKKDKPTINSLDAFKTISTFP